MRLFKLAVAAATVHHFWPWLRLLLSDLPWDIKIFTIQKALGL